MKPKPKTAAIAEALRQEIVSGELAPGSALNQVWLARRFGVSCIPVREALRTLEAEGHVIYRPYREALVTGLSQHDLEEALEIRSYLEPAIMRKALPKLQPSDIGLASTLLSAMNREKDLRKLHGMHANFHSILYEPGCSPKMAQIIRDNRLSTDRAQEQRLLKEFVRRSAPLHRRLLEACRAKSLGSVLECVKQELTLLQLLTASHGKTSRH